MWRICSCAQPLIGGTRRCQFPTDVNRNIRGRSSRSKLPPFADPSKIPNQPRLVQLADNVVQKGSTGKFESYTDHCRNRSSNCSLRSRNSCSDPVAIGKAEIYAKQHLLNNKRSESKSKIILHASAKSEICSKTNLVRNQSPTTSSWYGCSQKIISRLKDLLYEPKSVAERSQSEQFYDCQEPPMHKADNICKAFIKKKPKLIQGEEYVKEYNSNRMVHLEPEKCNPSDTPNLVQQEQHASTYKIHNLSKAVENNPYADTFVNTSFDVNQTPESANAIHGCRRWITCETHPGSLQKPGKSRCAKCETKPRLQPQIPKQLHAEYCKVKAMKFSLENPINCNGIQNPQQYYELITSVVSSSSIQGHDEKPTIDLFALRTKSLQTGKLSNCWPMQAAPFSTEAFADGTSNSTHVTKIAPSKSKHLKNQAKQQNDEDNILFNKLKGLSMSKKLHVQGHQNCSKKTVPQHCYRDQLANQNPKLNVVEWYEIDSNALFAKVKKSTSDVWACYTHKMKQDEPLKELRNMDKSVNSRSPLKKTFVNPYDCKRTNKFDNDMQKQNNKRCWQSHLRNGGLRNIESNLCMDALKNKMNRELKSNEKNSKNFNCNNKVNNTKVDGSRIEKPKRIKDFKEEIYTNILNESNLVQHLRSKMEEKHGTQRKKVPGFERQQLENKTKEEAFMGTEQISEKDWDRDLIRSEARQIDNIIKQCELLKRKYTKRLKKEGAQNLKHTCPKNIDRVRADDLILVDRCMETKEMQKGDCSSKRVVNKHLRKNLEAEVKNLQSQRKRKTCQDNKPNKEPQFQQSAGKNKVDKFEMPGFTTSKMVPQRGKKCKETEKQIIDAETAKQCWKEILKNHCRDAENEKKTAERFKQIQEAAQKKNRQQAEKLRKQSELQKLQAREIARNTANIEMIYKEAEKKAAQLEEQLKKTYEKHNIKGKCQDKGKRTDNTDDDALNKFKLSPWHRHNNGFSLTSSVHGCDTKDNLDGQNGQSGCPLICGHYQRGESRSVGLLAALGIPLTRRLDSKFYLFDLRNCLAHVDNLVQLQSSIQDEDDYNIEPIKNVSLIDRWARKFAELPLQLRPGSKILLPLTHSKCGYLIGESDELSSLMWADLIVDQESEYNDSDL